MSSLYVTKKNEMKIGYMRDGKCKVLHLGKKCTLSEGRTIQRLIDVLLESEERGTPPPDDVQESLHGLSKTVRRKLEHQKLFDYSAGPGASLVGLKEITDGEPMTKSIRVMYDRAWSLLLDYCPDDLTIRELDREAVENFGEYLLNEYAEKTVHERFKSLRRSFRYAQKKGAIYYNPFNDVRAGSDRGTPSEYVPVDVAEKVLPYCLDDETRLALVFGRFAGVRMPSEIRDLKWSDIEAGRFHVRKGKTGGRVVPLFPRVSEELMKQKRDSEWVFPIEHASNYCRAYWNIRRAVERSGVTPWSKLLNSLRASCITEYAHENFHEVTLNAVFGNSESVRKKHYVKVREKEYADMIRAGRLMHEKQPGREGIDAIIKLMPLLSKEEVLNLWENAQKGL